jgi:hypothetical protein
VCKLAPIARVSYPESELRQALFPSIIFLLQYSDISPTKMQTPT